MEVSELMDREPTKGMGLECSIASSGVNATMNRFTSREKHEREREIYPPRLSSFATAFLGFCLVFQLAFCFVDGAEAFYCNKVNCP